jgi:carboxypeptidase Taq
LFERADRDLGGLSAMFARGEFSPLGEWLRQKIHARGQCYKAIELGELVTGQPLGHAALMRYLRGKLEPLYGL